MTTATASSLMTTEELLALPEDGVDRELIRGQLRERPMTRRNYLHGAATITIGYVLLKWLEQQTDELWPLRARARKAQDDTDTRCQQGASMIDLRKFFFRHGRSIGAVPGWRP